MVMLTTDDSQATALRLCRSWTLTTTNQNFDLWRIRVRVRPHGFLLPLDAQHLLLSNPGTTPSDFRLLLKQWQNLTTLQPDQFKDKNHTNMCVAFASRASHAPPNLALYLYRVTQFPPVNLCVRGGDSVRRGWMDKRSSDVE